GAYGALTADSIQRDHRVGALLGTRGLFTALPATRPSGWQAFVQPYGYHATQDRREGLASHRTSETGVLVGLERSTREDWTYGLNLSISELDSTSRSPHNGKGSSTAFQLGVHTRYQPAQDSRLHFAAYARAGAEQGKMKRGVGFSDYQASHDSDWSGASFNAGLASAYAWPLNKAVAVGPVLGLDYVHAYRPGVDESGPAASKLNLSSLKADSLQSSLGLMARADWQLKNAQRLQGYMAVTWEHEWLSRYATQQARFASSPGIAFSQRIAVGAPDAMGLRAGMDFAPQPNVAVRASVATRLFSPGQQDVGADVSVSWAF
uniref:autotransporter outer membrane beta-barrel domain-containing protein n=1 Tax=Achromobacter insolitus TaxID=217204 RepID=UPI002FDD8586